MGVDGCNKKLDILYVFVALVGFQYISSCNMFEALNGRCPYFTSLIILISTAFAVGLVLRVIQKVQSEKKERTSDLTV